MPDRAILEELIAQAVLAPSSHNTQPWLFEIAGTELRLRADGDRTLPVNDPEDRELVISCGCALFNLRAAAAAAGLGCQVRAFPDAADPELLAGIGFAGPPDPALAALAPAIAGRRTHRGPFAAGAVAEGDVAALVRAAEAEGARLAIIGDAAQRSSIAELVAEGDAAQWRDPAWRDELARWMHPKREGDGLSLPAPAVPVARAVVRRLDLGGRVGAKDRALALRAPVLAVLGTDADGPADRLAAGQALQRLLLVAAAAGLQASYLNQPVQLPALRPRLAALCGGEGAPQILLRIGRQKAILPPAPRRPLAAVMTG
ncbi:Acg family FMN-binding oxidoreductase [Jannaschia ovalis]|uniref:Nitroreductase family protein n=1 Tax=Jannaschia ovalis TaxID=3038773 RepID=A0ABY8LA89_9RHOB|nr:nitroreductase family protein [Jannaschia sp. GRR-S6-38]WGH78216.1 nitroreductase family protein [Jannaschia sp. GRR-S6-38]